MTRKVTANGATTFRQALYAVAEARELLSKTHNHIWRGDFERALEGLDVTGDLLDRIRANLSLVPRQALSEVPDLPPKPQHPESVRKP